MNPLAKMGCSTLNPAAVPTYIATEFGPCSATIARTLAPISDSAVSHDTRSHCSPVRRIGNRSRSGDA